MALLVLSLLLLLWLSACLVLHGQNFDESAYLIKPPTQMMRFLDALRYHKPTDDERNELNISSSTERLHLHALNDVRLTDRLRALGLTSG